MNENRYRWWKKEPQDDVAKEHGNRDPAIPPTLSGLRGIEIYDANGRRIELRRRIGFRIDDPIT